MKLRLPPFLRGPRNRTAQAGTGSGSQPGLWSSTRSDLAISEGTPRVSPASQPVARGQNPFAPNPNPAATLDSVIANPSETPTGVRLAAAPAPRPVARRRPGLWHRWLVWIGWRPHSGARLRVFDNVEQLELVLGRPRGPVSPRISNDGPSIQTRRSGPVTGKSKVIYESPPAAAVDANRMMEESDRTYVRLRGRRLDSLRVTAD